jgi:outer membrane protein TolC
MTLSASLLLTCLTLVSAAPGGTLTLDQALREAKEKNLDLKAAHARLLQAHEISGKVWANYLPQIALGASYTRNQYGAAIDMPTGYYIRDVGSPAMGGPAFDPTQPIGPENPPGAPSNYVMYPSGYDAITIQKKDQLGAQVSVSQALIAPALWPAIQNAYVAEEVAELGVANAENELLFAVAQLYYGAASLKEVVGVQERLLENARTREKDAKVRVDAGTVPPIFLIRAQIDRARAEQDLLRAQNAFASARVALSTLLDRDADFDVVRPADPEAGAMSADLGDRVDDRPDVRLVRRSLDLAEGSRDGVWYKYLPNLGLQGTWRVANMKGFTDAYDAWAITLGLSWTLWDGGAREIELRESRAKLMEAELTRQATERKARDEVVRARLDLDSARAARIKADEQRRLAQENMRLVTVSYQSGAATQVELSDATTALAAAEVGAVAEALNAQLAALRVQKAVGAFRP